MNTAISVGICEFVYACVCVSPIDNSAFVLNLNFLCNGMFKTASTDRQEISGIFNNEAAMRYVAAVQPICLNECCEPHAVLCWREEISNLVADAQAHMHMNWNDTCVTFNIHIACWLYSIHKHRKSGASMVAKNAFDCLKLLCRWRYSANIRYLDVHGTQNPTMR